LLHALLPKETVIKTIAIAFILCFAMLPNVFAESLKYDVPVKREVIPESVRGKSPDESTITHPSIRLDNSIDVLMQINKVETVSYASKEDATTSTGNTENPASKTNKKTGFWLFISFFAFLFINLIICLFLRGSK
jgi:hypothetical protein